MVTALCMVEGFFITQKNYSYLYDISLKRKALVMYILRICTGVYEESQQFNSVCKPFPNIVSSIVFWGFFKTHYAVANFCLGHNSTFEKTFEFF